MFSKTVSEILTLVIQAFFITLSGWAFVFTCWDIKDMREELKREDD